MDWHLGPTVEDLHDDGLSGNGRFRAQGPNNITDPMPKAAAPRVVGGLGTSVQTLPKNPKPRP